MSHDETVSREPGVAPLAGTVTEPDAARAALPAGAKLVSPADETLAAVARAMKPGFEVAGELGRGGMGIVFRAKQASLARDVAVKTIRPEKSTAEARARFVAEALVTGALAHPNIVPVHDLGTTPSGEPFLSMKLVGGISWARLLHPKTPEERARAARSGREAHLRLLLAVCDAIDFAHSKGVVHRDLKPENVMVGEFGEVLVLDWGLALSTTEGGLAPRGTPGKVAGTPAYMPPELVEGRVADAGPWTDVFLLGAILHEIVTGTPPNAGETLGEVLLAAIEPPERVYPDDVPEELRTILARALAPKESDRFQTVRALRSALEAHLAHLAAHAIAAKGRAALAELRATCARRSSEDGRAIDRLHGEARFAFAHALSSWPDMPEALAGRREASHLVLDHALATEDLALATRLLPELDDPTATARVETLRLALEARARELTTLREAARRLDWSSVARPLGSVFLFAGVAGSLSAFVTAAQLTRTPATVAAPTTRDVLAGPLTAVSALWAATLLGIGAFAWVRLRRTSVPDSLVSPRLLGTWGAVAFGCALVGVLSALQGHPAFADTCYAALLIGIGFMAMAFQTRRWVLVPGLVFVAMALGMTIGGPAAVVVYGIGWLLAVGGMGVALRLGARLD